MLSKSCLLHHRSPFLFKTQDHSLVPLPGDNNSDPLEVRSMKRISQVLKRHYIAYIHSCLADLCLIFLQAKFSRSSQTSYIRLRKQKRPLACFLQQLLIIHVRLCVCVRGVPESKMEMRHAVLMLVFQFYNHFSTLIYRSVRKDLGPCTQPNYTENIQFIQKKERLQQRTSDTALLYNSILTLIFISMHLFTLSEKKIKVHREFLLPWEEIYLFLKEENMVYCLI